MNHKPHIRFINPHTESDRSHNDFHFFHQEIILILRPRQWVHTRMVRTRVDTVCLKNFSKFFYSLPTKAVNDTRFFRIILDKLDNITINISSFRAYLIIQVRTVERWLENLCIHHSQILLDIVLHLWRCRCSKCYQRSLSDLVDDRTNPPIFRPEVMPPFGNTVSLVYRVKRNFHRAQKIYVLFLCQRLRSHI